MCDMVLPVTVFVAPFAYNTLAGHHHQTCESLHLKMLEQSCKLLHRPSEAQKHLGGFLHVYDLEITALGSDAI